MANILALETTSLATSVALLAEGKLYTRLIVKPKAHGEVLLPLIDELLALAKIDLKALDKIIFGNGPGSFTGQRFAATVANALSYAAGVPVVGISSLQCLAQTSYRLVGAKVVITAVNASLEQVYWAIYKLNKTTGIMEAIIPSALLKVTAVQFADIGVLTAETAVLVGDAFVLYPQLLATLNFKNEQVLSDLYPEASDLITLSLDKNSMLGSATFVAAPVYLQDASFWKKAIL